MRGCRQLELVRSSAQDPLVQEVASLTAELQEARKQAESARIAAGAAASEAKVARTGAQWAKDRMAQLERFALRHLSRRKARLSGCQHRLGRPLDVLWKTRGGTWASMSLGFGQQASACTAHVQAGCHGQSFYRHHMR